MSLFTVDQSKDKQYCIDLLDQLAADADDPRYNEACESTLSKIMDRAQHWNVSADKLQRLLRSQMLSGNIPGAAKVIKHAIPNQRIKAWVTAAGLALLVGAFWYVRSRI